MRTKLFPGQGTLAGPGKQPWETAIKWEVLLLFCMTFPSLKKHLWNTLHMAGTENSTPKSREGSGMVASTLSPSTQEAETDRCLWVWDQPGLQREFKIVRPTRGEAMFWKSKQQKSHRISSRRHSENIKGYSEQATQHLHTLEQSAEGGLGHCSGLPQLYHCGLSKVAQLLSHGIIIWLST